MAQIPNKGEYGAMLLQYMGICAICFTGGVCWPYIEEAVKDDQDFVFAPA